MQRVKEPARQTEETFLIVRVGQIMYAIPSRHVQRVIRALEIHPIPHVPPEVLGLAGVGSEPVLVLDLSLMAGHGPFNPGERPLLVVIRADSGTAQRTVGLAVDDALKLETFEWDPDSAGEAGFTVRLMEAADREIYRVNLENVVFASLEGL